MRLELIRAGAGAGKTTNLCEMVCDMVTAGLDPARILATTYTRKAAAELKNRVMQALITRRHASRIPSDRLELATIGTVHSVAHAVIGKYASRLGLSPKIQVMDETAGNAVQQSLLGQLSLDMVMRYAEKLELSGELRSAIVAILNMKRGNRIGDNEFMLQMESSLNEVLQLLAPGGFKGTSVDGAAFRLECAEILKQMHRLGDTTKETAKGMESLRSLAGARELTWKMISGAGSIKAGKKSGANELLDGFRNKVSAVRRNPALEADLRGYYESVSELVLRFGNLYENHKKSWGFVDYNDLESLFLDLLENPELQDCLKSDYSLVAVDEFQDTNPMQLAIFMRLRAIADTTRWTGDPNQAIYGFRGTDPALSENVWSSIDAAPGSQKVELSHNHRSQAGLVNLFNKVFPKSEGFNEQIPTRAATRSGIERWIFESENNAEDHAALASGIARLQDQNKIAWRDIAVLMATNYALGSFANELTKIGIPFNLGSNGVFKTMEGMLFIAGLRLVSDRHDSLAAATVLHILSNPQDETPTWLKERLEALQSATSKGKVEAGHRQVPWQDDPRLAPLEGVAKEQLPPALMARKVAEALRLGSLAASWGNPTQRAMNIDMIIALADSYEESAASTNSAATLSGLILHLEELDNYEGESHSNGIDAVTLSTYHAAKGLEWPIVILADLNYERDPFLWQPVAWGSSSLDDPLANRSLRYWAWPFGKTNNPYRKDELTKGCGLNADALLSPIGIEAATKNDKEKLRLLYVGMTRARDKLVIAHRKDKYGWLKEKLPNFDDLAPPNLGEGEHNLPEEIGTTLRVRHLSPSMAASLTKPAPSHENWIDAPIADPVPTFTERHHAPSKAPVLAKGTGFEAHKLEGERIFPTGAKEEEFGAIGDATHAYLAALPSMRHLKDDARERIAIRCISNHGVSGIVDSIKLLQAGQTFEKWVAVHYPKASWHCEVYGTGPRSAGGQWDGWMDLLLELPDGKLALIDHKTAPLRPEQCLAKAQEYSGQLTAYREMLLRAGKELVAAWIHFPFGATMVRATWNT